MSPTLFKLCVFAVIVSAVLSFSVSNDGELERRGIGEFFSNVGSGIKNAAGAVGHGIQGAAGAVGHGIQGAAGAVGHGIQGAAGAVGHGIQGAAGAVGHGIQGAIDSSIMWMWRFPADYDEADTVEEEAEIVLTEAENTIQQGNGLISEGERLLRQAEELERALDLDLSNSVVKRDADGDIDVEDKPRRIRAAIRALRAAAQRTIAAGRKIAANSEKIAEALNEAIDNISAVVADGVKDVGFAVAEVTVSVVEATSLLNQIKTSTSLLNLASGDTVEKLEETGELVVKAGKSFEEVGRRSINLVTRIVNLGQDIVSVVTQAAINIWNATGIPGK